MKLIIVDLDGTLFDTKDVNYHAYKEAIAPYGYDMDYKYYCEFCNGRHYLDFLPQVTTTDSEILSAMHKAKKIAYKNHLDSMIVTNEILYHHVPDENSISHLSYSEKKYSAISMWEKINADTSAIYPEYLKYARISLTSAAVFGLFEARQCCYKNKNQLKYMRSITRKNIGGFLKADYISKKFKVYAIVVCIGF